MTALPAPVIPVTDTLLHELDRRLPPGPDALLLHGSICWGREFFPASDVDVVVVWPELPEGDQLSLLEQAHLATHAAHPDLVVDGFHCIAADLAGPPDVVGTRPVFYEGAFDPTGTIDINWPTWHELAERGIAVRGAMPPVHTDHAALLAYTRHNLDTYWRDLIPVLTNHDSADVGRDDDAVRWVVLGAARLHHLLATGAMTSKSGAGRYVRDALDQRWQPIGAEALRLREDPTAPSDYADPADRGPDTLAFLTWVLCDGTAR